MPDPSRQVRALRAAPPAKRPTAPTTMTPSTLEEAFLMMAQAIHLLATREQVAPVVNVEPAQVTVKPADVHVSAPVSVSIPEVNMPPVQVRVVVPDQPSAQVIVRPEIKAPDVHITTPDVQDIRIVSTPPVSAEFSRDKFGRIESAKVG